MAGKRLNRDLAIHAAKAMEHGIRGCRTDPKMAFDILDRLTPDPIPVDTAPELIWQLRNLSRHSGLAESHPRLWQISAMTWLIREGQMFPEANVLDRDKLRAFLLRPGNWEAAVQRFGLHYSCGGPTASSESLENTSPERDAMVLEALTDPASPRFDLARAAALAGTTEIASVRAQVATALLDPAKGPPNPAAAAALLDWYSPYRHPNLTEEQATQVQQDMAIIAAHRTSAAMPSPAPQPDASDMLELDSWPASLQPIDLGAVFSPDDYSSRAMREGVAGAVKTALVFGPDGAFSRLAVLRSSGNIDLDERTTTLILRRARPQLSTARLEGHAGRTVLLPLPVVEWHLASPASRWTEGVTAEPGTFRIVTRQRRARILC